MKLPQSVNILLLGSGGREHAFAWKIRQSPRLGKLFIAPGNAGTARLGTNVDVQPANFGSVKQFILLNNINLVVCGPEDPLVKGLADFVNEDSEIHHVPVIGPSAAGARLEGSKQFAKEFMVRHGIPTAQYNSFTKKGVDNAHLYLNTIEGPYVLKADGLAAGKGVVICSSREQAHNELDQMLGGKFGAAGNCVVIEQFLQGIECSVFVATDGSSYALLPTAKDYKRIGDGDTGLNTGGMGAVSPVPFADQEFMDKVRVRIIEPTVRGLQKENIPYKGFIFIGLMNCDGDPYVIEYNVRLGDPEAEAILPRIDSDIVELFEAMAFNRLGEYEVTITDRTSVTVICAAGGYPGQYAKGDRIDGIPEAEQSGAIVFQAGTRRQGDIVETSGGRVLAVTALADNLPDAISACYQARAKIDFNGIYYRKDIGKDLLGG